MTVTRRETTVREYDKAGKIVKETTTVEEFSAAPAPIPPVYPPSWPHQPFIWSSGGNPYTVTINQAATTETTAETCRAIADAMNRRAARLS